LFSKPPGWEAVGAGAGAAPTPTPARPPEFAAANPIHSPPAGGGGGIWGGALAAMAAAVGGGRPSSSGGGAAPPPPPPPTPATIKPDLDAAFRKLAIAGLTARLQGSLAADADAAAATAAASAADAAALAARAAEVDSRIDAVRAEKSALEAAVAGLGGAAKSLDAWLAAHESKAPPPAAVDASTPPATVDADAAVEPADPLSAQALAAQAEDMAVEDALYALDRALAAGGLACGPYLKAVRGLAARQYTLRATGNAVAAAQHGRGGGRAPGGGQVAMPQGDSWSSTGVLANPLAQGGGG
jgi:ESCRT-I complex subunit TSG101